MTDKPAVYLAGPAVFHPAAAHIFDYLKEVCARHGLIGISPLDSPADPAAIRRANVEKIRGCRAVIACISPFRGAGADPGTAWEMGYAEALGKPVVAWCEDARPYIERVPHDPDADGRPFCRQHGMLVEDFGLLDNLMLTAGPHPVQPDFEAAVVLTVRLLAANGTHPA